MLTPALVLLGADSYAEHGRWRATFGMRRADAWSQWTHRTLLRMAVFAATGLVCSAILSRDGSWTFVRSVYGSRLFFDDLAPSAGLAWYFFVQMFEHFHSFFVLVVNLHMWAYMVPVTIKYRSDPLFAVTVLYGIQCLFQNYTSVGDTALFMALWSLSSTRLSDCTCRASHRPPLSHGNELAVCLHDAPHACIPLPVALRGLGKCQFLLRHQPRARSRHRQPDPRRRLGLGA